MRVTAAAWPALCLLSVGLAADGQTVTHSAQRAGIDIQDTTIDLSASTATLTFRNTGTKGMTAFVVNVSARYADGEELNYETKTDFFESIGLEQFDSPSKAWGTLLPGRARVLTVPFLKPAKPGSALANLDAVFTGVVFDDESTSGTAAALAEISAKRDAQSAELLRWCGDLKQITSGPISRKNMNDFLARHTAENANADAANGAAGAARRGMVSVLKQGVEWSGDDNGLMRSQASQMLDAECSAANLHMSARKEIR